MPVTKLFVEGDLDEEVLTGIFAGAPVVEKRGGWLQWQFNLRKVEFAGVSAYFYGHGHHAAELKTRSVLPSP